METGRCVGLNDLLGKETTDISLADASRMGIEHGQTIYVNQDAVRFM